MAQKMHEYAFDVELKASIRVKAVDEYEARAALARHIDSNTANLGSWPNGDPILAEVSLALNEEKEGRLYEIDGEPV